jgi:nitroreductase
MTANRTTTPEALSAAVTDALRAPSILNTQPWQWRVDGRVAELRVDRRRQLPALDPQGRFAVLSCGVALHYLRTALAARGAAARLEMSDDAADPDLLARVEWSGEGHADERAEMEHAALMERRTDRRVFASEPLPAPTVEALCAVAEQNGAALHLIGPRQLTKLIYTADRASELELSNPGSVGELTEWTSRPASAHDGVPPETAAPATRRRVPLRNFMPEGTPTLDPGSGDDASATYALLHVPADTRRYWLDAGLALGAVLGAAARLGVAASPMSDLVEVPATQMLLRGILSGLREPMLVLRLGRPGSSTPPPASPRRAVEDVVEDGLR